MQVWCRCAYGAVHHYNSVVCASDTCVFCGGTIASLTCVPHAAAVGRMLREMLDQRCPRSSFNVVTSV